MSNLTALLTFIGIGIWGFLLFCLPEVLNHFSNNKLKIEKERTEQKRLEYETAKIKAGVTDTTTT